MNLIILGPQGSGKGTQARLLAKKLKLFYFESGDFLRDLAKEDKRIDKLINEEGKMVPNDEIFALAKKYLEENVPTRDGMILDGYPRSVRQHEFLKDWLEEKGKDIDSVILLEVSEKESIRRLSARRICEECGTVYNLITNPPSSENTCRCGGKLTKRVDDEPEAIKTRLGLYHKETEPLISIFENEKILMRVDGEKPIQQIFVNIMVGLKKISDE